MVNLLSNLIKPQYDSVFFDGIAIDSEVSALRMVPRLVDLLTPDSVVDVGCGTGTWLKSFRDAGVIDIQGIEGGWIGKSSVATSDIPIEIMDLNHPAAASRRFDLALSLEVAEHLKPDAAADFIDFLTSLADVIIFSAAVPLQGGFAHLNEQWPPYWSKYFDKKNYLCYDVIRPLFWSDDKIAPFYAQNMFIYVKKKLRKDLHNKLAAMHSFTPYGVAPVALIHPGLFEDVAALKYTRPTRLARALPPAVFSALKERFNKLRAS